MFLHYVAFATSLLLYVTVLTQAERDIVRDGPEFTHEWAVRVLGGEHHARQVAADTGFTFVKPVRPFKINYLFLVKIP